LPGALYRPFDDLDCDSPVILKVFEYRFTREIGDSDIQRCGVFFRSRQPKFDDGIVLGLVRQSGQRAEMAIAKKRIRLEVQDSAFVLEVHIIVAPFDHDWTSDFPVCDDPDPHLLLGYPLLHQIGVRQSTPHLRRGCIDRDGVLNHVTHRPSVYSAARGESWNRSKRFRPLHKEPFMKRAEYDQPLSKMPVIRTLAVPLLIS
jgi:hypothetical protein